MKTVIEMAREADRQGETTIVSKEWLERFAALVRENERERERLMDYAAAELNIHSAVLAEREACAKVCWDLHTHADKRECAEAIRARGEK